MAEASARGIRRPWHRHANLVLGAVITCIIVLAALLSLVWTPYSTSAVDIANKLAPPSWAHPLGTDHFGRDMLSLIIEGARNSIAVGLVAIVIGIGIGTPLGLIAAATRGPLDALIMRFSDFVFAFPALLSAVTITAIFGPGAINAIIAIGIFNIPVFARLSRGAALPLWQRDFIAAATLSGKSTARINIEHILPNITNILVVQATIQFAIAILAEAGLSYLGLGTQPPSPSWGKMLNDAQTLIYLAPRLAIVPGLAIVIAVLGLNLLGDGLRDRLDPRACSRG
jgi:peptide/nickel transport system permease protein